MGKATVEDSLRLDAHYWGQPGMDRLTPKLAARLAEARAREADGKQTPEGEQTFDGTQPGVFGPTGLMEMRWTRGGAPAGNLKWGVLAQEGGQVKRLVLLFQITSRGTAHLRRQSVGLDWTTPAGKPLRLPVLLCPFCGRRCRFLCAAYPGRRGGPYLGEFACRQCAGLCYAQQLEYRSASVKNFQSLLNLSTKLMLHPERATQADLDKAEALIQKPLGFGSQVDKLLARLEERADEQNNQNQNKQNTAFGMKKPHEGDVLAVFTPPKRRGRPNVKKQRQQARECARIVREAERQARPKRPAGRPKARRAYDAAGRRESGCGGQLGPGEGYCVGCRGGRRIVDAEAFTASNGRGGIKGKCAVCGRGLCRMGVKDLIAL